MSVIFCDMFFKVIFILLFCYDCVARDFRNLLRKYGCRSNRNCNASVEDEDDAFYRRTIFENPLYLTLIVILGIFFFLIFLGFMKGLIGLIISKRVGVAGLHLLIDLPRSICEYEERELKHRCIIYDVGGWPVHPDTKERSVRVMSKKMEFCLNLIFFLAYPMSAIISLCTSCCCIETVNEHDEESKCLNSGKGKIDMYNDEDLKEDQDTNYVINILKQSKLNFKPSTCCE